MHVGGCVTRTTVARVDHGNPDVAAEASDHTAPVHRGSASARSAAPRGTPTNPLLRFHALIRDQPRVIPTSGIGAFADLAAYGHTWQWERADRVRPDGGEDRADSRDTSSVGRDDAAARWFFID